MIVLSSETILGTKKIELIRHHGGSAQYYFVNSKANPDRRVKLSDREVTFLRDLNNKVKRGY